MEQGPSWEANRFSAFQEIHLILWNPRVHYRIHKFPPPVPTLSQLDPVHSPGPTSWRSILILSSHLRLGLPSGSYPQVSPPKPCIRVSPPHTFYMPHPSHYFWFNGLIIWQRKYSASDVFFFFILVVFIWMLCPWLNILIQYFCDYSSQSRLVTATVPSYAPRSQASKLLPVCLR